MPRYKAQLCPYITKLCPMSVVAKSPLSAFYLVLIGVLTYQLLFALAGHYLNDFPFLPRTVGHILFVWVPLFAGALYFSWVTRAIYKVLLLRHVLAIVAAVISICVSSAATFALQVSIWGM